MCFERGLVRRQETYRRRTESPISFSSVWALFADGPTENIHILLATFSVRTVTVNYGPTFFPLSYGPSAKRAGHKRGSVIYSTDRKNEVNKMFTIWLFQFGEPETSTGRAT